jgi:aspartyl/asparaginyl-tRNA synthetase
MSKHSLHSSFYPHIEAKEFTQVTNQLRHFFQSRGFLEVHTQNRLSILAACEDPFNLGTYNYQGQVWPLPQTGQMWLEHELLTQPETPGFFCLSTSYRAEKNPVEGRHCLIFPMFEFEAHGTIEDLANLEQELLQYLGLGQGVFRDYEEACAQYQSTLVGNDIELLLCQEQSTPVLLTQFPERTNPFWNMKRDVSGRAQKIDVLISGQETIGSAERSCDPDQMRESFFHIESGRYADKLFDLFGYNRVMSELNEFLALPFTPRFGGGIGITRLIRGLKNSNLL